MTLNKSGLIMVYDLFKVLLVLVLAYLIVNWPAFPHYKEAARAGILSLFPALSHGSVPCKPFID